jgi:hypothetical protein
LAEITSTIVDFKLNPIHQVEVEKVITGLCDALGASERIFTSPVPTFYTRHTARFLAFWLLALPTALYDPFKVTWNHWAVIPATVVLSGFLLGIEELATQMEEPFSILPLEKMCEGSIRISVMEQVERSKNGNQGTNGALLLAPAALSSGIPSSNGVKSGFGGNLSKEDMEKIELYFVEEEEEEKGKAGNEGINGASSILSVDEMNKAWASMSGSKS